MNIMLKTLCKGILKIISMHICQQSVLSMDAEIIIPVPNMPMIININSNHPGNFNKTFQTSDLELQSLVKLNEYHIG